MLTESTKKEIAAIWDNYVEANRTVLDTKGNVISDINASRLVAIGDIVKLINKFRSSEYNIYEFKTALDSYNKRNNLWGFTATKGQMFFNQLTKTNEHNISKFELLLRDLIAPPANLPEALHKIETLEQFASEFFKDAKDKRKAPNPGSVGYFLSYFWQIYNHEEWPIIYTSLIVAFKELGIWVEHGSQKGDYHFFYELNNEIRQYLATYTNHPVSNWDAEHAFWNFKGNPINNATQPKTLLPTHVPETDKVEVEVKIKANFELTDYIIPRVAKLIEVGGSSEMNGAAKGSEYEKLVVETFKQLDFEVEPLGQGKGRNPDAIIKFREEHTAFIIDAKAYVNGYTLGLDDRAIREYINHYCPKLRTEGFRKIGFIIVSNSFKFNPDSFVSEITWNTEIKRFLFVTSEALLYLLAFKTKDKIALSSIIESLVNLGNVITSETIIDKYGDF
jgi:hypothetical protein